MRSASQNGARAGRYTLRSGPAQRRRGARPRVLLLLAALLPVAILAIWDALCVYRAEVVHRETEFVRTARLLLGDRHRSLQAAASLLGTLGRLAPVASSGGACDELTRAALRSLDQPAYAAMAVFDGEGHRRCGSSGPGQVFDVGTQRWFEELRDGREWAVSVLPGEGATLPARGFVLAAPLHDDHDERRGAIGLVVDAGWLSPRQHPAAFGRHSLLVLLDRNDHPVFDVASQSLAAMPRDPSVVPLAAARGRGQVAEGRDGVTRLYAVVPLLGTQLRALAGAPTQTVYGPLQRQLVLRLLLPPVMLLLAAAAAWISIRDVERLTERTRAREQSWRDQLARQELLVREVHHRVKNNLQMVMSLLALHARRMPAGEVRRGFEDASARLAALALVHRRLQDAASLEEVDAGGFLRELCRDLEANRPGRAGNVELAVRVAPLTLPPATAVPIGLLVNEAVINAYKHAFAGRDHGRIEVILEPADDAAQLRLEIRDDGDGYDTAAGGSGLGMTLIGGFARQLGGTLELAARSGTRLTVVFPRPDAA